MRRNFVKKIQIKIQKYCLNHNNTMKRKSKVNEENPNKKTKLIFFNSTKEESINYLKNLENKQEMNKNEKNILLEENNQKEEINSNKNDQETKNEKNKDEEEKEIKRNKCLLGAHISIKGGISESIKNGESIGCTAIQIFTKSNRSYKSKELSKKEVDLFKQSLQNSKIKHVIVHACYLINLASIDPTVVTNSINALSNEIDRCLILGIECLVLHPGSHIKLGNH
jgi:hypothetical protein